MRREINVRKSINQTDQQIRTVQNAEKSHGWPVQIGEPTETAWQIYLSGQSQRSFDDWPALDLIELARVSRLIDLCDSETDYYVEEGATVMGGISGTTRIENPRGRAISTLNSTINSSLRRLGISSMSVSDKRSQANRGKAERKARSALATHDVQSRSGRDLM